jgi:prenyltransferase beta subunit
LRHVTQKDETDWEIVASDHFRMSGVYWALAALSLLPGAELDSFLPINDVVTWIETCRKPDGSYAPNSYHDGCLLSTLSAVQILTLLGRLDAIDKDAVAACKPFPPSILDLYNNPFDKASLQSVKGYQYRRRFA